MAKRMLYEFGRMFIPKQVQPNLRLHLLKAGYDEVPYTMFGIIFLAVSAFTYFLYIGFFYTQLRQYDVLVFGFLTFVVFAISMFLIIFTVFVLMYFRWNVRIYQRTKELELLLPDYLTLVSTNLKGGMSFENSLWNAIKPEFGILANEIGLVSKRVMTGNEVTEAVMEFSLKYDSPSLRRTLQLVIGEVESGGRIVETIDKIIADMRKSEALKKEMAASTVTYMIFIGMLVAVICPVLFALSLQLFTITSGFIGNVAGSIGSTTSVGGSFSVSAPTLGRSDFRLFSILAISIIAIFSSVIIAIIEKGNIRSGLKYIPMFLVSSLTIYIIAVGIFGFMFGSLTL